MKFKLDENLGPTIQAAFAARNADYNTVHQEGLGGASDEAVLAAAVAEGRILVTNDHDFANVLRYPPDRTTGVAVLSWPGRPTRAALRSLAESLLDAFDRRAIRGKLWIVEPTRIREHEPTPDERDPTG